MVLSGVLQGGVYAMFAVGLTLIFGVMRIINAAHGEMVMMGAYLTWVAFFYLGVDPLLSLVLTLPIAVVFGVVLGALLSLCSACRRARNGDKVSPLERHGSNAIAIDIVMQMNYKNPQFVEAR